MGPLNVDFCKYVMRQVVINVVGVLKQRNNFILPS